MFNNTTQKAGTEHLGKTNRIVEGTIITGDITSLADFRLDGELIGNFSSKGKIVIGSSGKITGDINCQNADIEGEFIGNIRVIELLNVKVTARINGEVTVGKLAVEPGADFSATCIMAKHLKNGINDKPETKQELSKQETKHELAKQETK